MFIVAYIFMKYIEREEEKYSYIFEEQEETKVDIIATWLVCLIVGLLWVPVMPVVLASIGCIIVAKIMDKQEGV